MISEIEASINGSCVVIDAGSDLVIGPSMFSAAAGRRLSWEHQITRVDDAPDVGDPRHKRKRRKADSPVPGLCFFASLAHLLIP